ncbi:MAG: AAA family ATPase [Bacilli bacterium]|nr:AAA family ATPase [Bacilli bacterium]
MEEKYIITLYEKVNLTENVIAFKKNRIIKNAYIDFDDDFQVATYYDEDQKKVSIEMLENPYTIVSDDKYCYDFATKLSDLKSLYPEYKDDTELYKKYEEDISKVFEISYYDEKEDRVKFLSSNESLLGEVEEDSLFNNFIVEFDSDNSIINIQKNDIQKMLKMIEKQNYKLLKEQLSSFSEELEYAEDYFLNFLEEETEKEIIEDDNSIEDSLKKLDDLIGLDNIKFEITRLIKYLEFRDKSQKYLKLEKPNLHMFFTGNPGTGKTTVARIISEILYKLGYTKNNKFIEITPKDLIAEYVGQTAVKTAELLKQNEGGVIFIDEAYVLASSAQQYGQEALVEIIKELEKKETTFIFAGYKDEMKKFMELNPGLTSRIGYYLEYPDYNIKQLYQIFEYKTKDMGFKIDDKLKDKIINNLNSIKGEKHFGNGRYIDKLINKLILEHAINTERYKRKRELITLSEKDFNEEVGKSLIYKTKVKKIGFN